MKQVVVTGSSGGVGQGIGRAFRAAGWQTFGVDREPDPADSPYEHLILGDLALPESIATLFGELGDAPATSRCIVNNAAVQVCAPVEETPLEVWEQTMAVNLRAPYLMIRHGLAWLQAAKSASVVNVTSVHAKLTSPSIAAYAASKGGLDALTRAASLDLAEKGIRVNGIAPGAIDTPMLRAGLGRRGDRAEEVLARLGEAHPVGRVGRADEVGFLAQFLADPDRGGYFNGATLTLDGGASARLSTE